jgi:radical SAM-linked protein
MAYSAGFHPHPRISYINAAPTGVGSEAEYLEIAVDRHCEPEDVRAAIDAVMPDGLDIVFAMDATDCPVGSLAEQMQASVWMLELAATVAAVEEAVEKLLATDSLMVERPTKDGTRSIDARHPIVSARVRREHSEAGHAILDLVVRQVTPAVRPNDVLTALYSVSGFAPSQPPRTTRLAQGPIDESGEVGDPLRMTKLLSTEAPIGTR